LIGALVGRKHRIEDVGDLVALADERHAFQDVPACGLDIEDGNRQRALDARS
jgi:hypothetical protein